MQGPEPFAAWLDEHLAPEPYRADTAAEYRMLCDEVRIGCTYAMLLTLSRGLRIAYILGDLLEMTDHEGAEALGITPAAFRQRVARARKAVLPILARRCGLVDSAASCDCGRMIEPSITFGIIPQGNPVFTRLERERPTVDPAAFRRAADQLDIAEQFAGRFRNEPQFQAPASVLAELPSRCPDLLGEAP